MHSAQMKNQKGVGLIEVLVTLLILSTSLIALASLQTRSLQFNQGAYLRSQANIFAYDILDRIRINKNNIGSYTSPLESFEGTPTATPLHTGDLQSWRKNIASYLPNGKGAVACDTATRMCTVTIVWDELDSLESQGTPLTFSYSARI